MEMCKRGIIQKRDRVRGMKMKLILEMREKMRMTQTNFVNLCLTLQNNHHHQLLRPGEDYFKGMVLGSSVFTSDSFLKRTTGY